jgi:hypothetical protein
MSKERELLEKAIVQLSIFDLGNRVRAGDEYAGKTLIVKNFARAIEKAHGIGGEE